jgi:hypothetical protein
VTLLVLFILAVIWAAVLLPPWLQSRNDSRPADSMTNFRHQLSVLERRAGSIAPYRVAASSPNVTPMYPYGSSIPGGVGRPMANGRRSPVRMTRNEARRRRRDVFTTLGAGSLLTFMMAVFMGGPVWILAAVVMSMFGAFAFLNARVERSSAERDSKLRYLPERGRSPEPAYLLRRSAN